MYETTYLLLFNASWQSLVLWLVVVTILFLLRRRIEARWRYALCALVLLRLAMPILPATPWGVWSPAETPQEVTIIETEPSHEIRSSPLPDIPFEPVPHELTVAPPLEREYDSPPIVTEIVRQEISEAVPITAKTMKTKTPHWNWSRIFITVWLCGAVLLTLRLFLSELRLLHIRSRWKAAEDASLLELFSQCCRQIGLRRSVRLLISGDEIGAASGGFFRPLVVISETAIESLKREELRMILLHELMHVKRLDPLVQRLSLILTALHWFNPVVWDLRRRMRRERELACDAAVLRLLGSGRQKAYGNVLITFAQLFTPRHRLPGLVGVLHKDGIERRIEMIVHYRKSTWKSVTFGLCLLTLIGAVGLTRAQAPKEPAQNESVTETPPALPENLEGDEVRLPPWIGWIPEKTDLERIRKVRSMGSFLHTQASEAEKDKALQEIIRLACEIENREIRNGVLLYRGDALTFTGDAKSASVFYSALEEPYKQWVEIRNEAETLLAEEKRAEARAKIMSLLPEKIDFPKLTPQNIHELQILYNNLVPWLAQLGFLEEMSEVLKKQKTANFYGDKASHPVSEDLRLFLEFKDHELGYEILLMYCGDMLKAEKHENAFRFASESASIRANWSLPLFIFFAYLAELEKPEIAQHYLDRLRQMEFPNQPRNPADIMEMSYLQSLIVGGHALEAKKFLLQDKKVEEPRFVHVLPRLLRELCGKEENERYVQFLDENFATRDSSLWLESRPSVYAELIRAYMYLGEKEKATAIYENAKRQMEKLGYPFTHLHSSNQKSALLSMAECEAALGNSEAALKIWNEYLATAPSYQSTEKSSLVFLAATSQARFAHAEEALKTIAALDGFPTVERLDHLASLGTTFVESDELDSANIILKMLQEQIDADTPSRLISRFHGLQLRIDKAQQKPKAKGNAVYFPNDPEEGRKLDALLNAADKDSRSDEEIIETVRRGFLTSREHKMSTLRWIGNKYIWGKDPQNEKAIKLMIEASRLDEFDCYHSAVYFGLSTVNKKTPEIYKAMIDVAMKTEDYFNTTGRIEWGCGRPEEKTELLRYLRPFLESREEAVRVKAENVRDFFNDKQAWFAKSREENKRKAREIYVPQFAALQKRLIEGNSESRMELFTEFYKNNVTLVLDESFKDAFESCAQDSEPRVRAELARLVGGAMIWSAEKQSPMAVALMEKLVKDPDRDVRYNAVYHGLSTLRERNETQVAELLTLILDDREPNLFRRVIWGLQCDKDKVKTVLENWISNEKDPERIEKIVELFVAFFPDEPPPQARMPQKKFIIAAKRSEPEKSSRARSIAQ